MTYLNTFERYEIKYILTDDQRSRLEHLMSGRMKIDRYGHSTIRNIYYDTDDYRLIRHSLDRPVYKEKLRVRSYGRISEEDDVFVELKKKYDSVVYKRRIALPEHTATEWLSGDGQLRVRSQIGDEIGVTIHVQREEIFDKMRQDNEAIEKLRSLLDLELA